MGPNSAHDFVITGHFPLRDSRYGVILLISAQTNERAKVQGISANFLPNRHSLEASK
jgi:hypothetical protein